MLKYSKRLPQMFLPLLDRYRGECMVSIMDINNGIKESTCRYQNYDTMQILICGGYAKVGESLYTQVIIWVTTSVWEVFGHSRSRS
jgi:hypothetical protein